MEKVLNLYRYRSIFKKEKFYLIFSCFAIFIGQVVFFDFANPFFASFLALFLGESNFVFFIILVPLLIGISVSFTGVFLYTYIFIGILMFLFNFYLNYERIKISNKVKVYFCSISIFLGGLIPIYSYNMSFSYILYFLIFGFIGGFFTLIMQEGFNVITLKKNINTIKTNEIIGISIVVSSMLLGILNVDFQRFNLFLFLTYFLILVLSNSVMKNNTLTFAFIVTILPFLTDKISENEFIIILVLSASTLVVPNNDKKLLVLSSFPFLILSYLYIDSSFFIMPNVLAISFGMLLFLAIPNEFYNNIQTKYGTINNSFYPYANKIKDYCGLSLKNYSRAFLNLSNIFSEVIKKDTALTMEDYKKVAENVTNKVCKNCRSYHTCYVDTSYTTQAITRNLIKSIENNDNELFEKTFYTFSKLCFKTDEFVKVLNIYFELLKEETNWKNKLIENKILVSEQLKEISNVFLNINDDISKNITFQPKIERKLKNKFYIHNLQPTNVLVYKNSDNILNINIIIDIDINDFTLLKTITDCCNEVTDKNMKIVKSSLLENKNCEIILEELSTYDIMFGVSYLKKDGNEISGDSYSTLNLGSKSAMLAISDGMGSGKEASIMSTLSLNLFEEFLESGFDKDTAIKLINSSLLIKNTNDGFATIDSIIVDLYDGEAEFIKIGAVQSFILRDRNVISINSKTLPVGIVKNIETQIYKKQIQNNDYLVLVSDGILDVITSYKKQDAWIKDILKRFNGNSSKSLSDYIIKEALLISNNVIKDDMTVVVGKIIKNY